MPCGWCGEPMLRGAIQTHWDACSKRPAKRGRKQLAAAVIEALRQDGDVTGDVMQAD